MKTINFYIGFLDKDSKRYHMSIHECETVTKAVALDFFKSGYTFTETEGVYEHDNGEIVVERGCKITVFMELDLAGETMVDSFVKNIKEQLNQESVAVEVIESKITFA